MSGSSHLSIAKARTTAANEWTELAIRGGDGLGISLLFYHPFAYIRSSTEPAPPWRPEHEAA